MDSTADRLKERMNELGVSQSELVKRTGINKGALSSYISGRYLHKQKATYALAKALNVNEAWLMGFDVPKERCENNAEALANSITEEEKEHLKLYRSLDEKGKHTVNTVALMEYDRIKNEHKKSAGTPTSTKNE